jgi:hypothetical protein
VLTAIVFTLGASTSATRAGNPNGVFIFLHGVFIFLHQTNGATIDEPFHLAVTC